MAKGSVNKVIVLGRLGQDPDVKTTQGGSTIANLSIATTELGRKDQATGQREQDVTEWHRVTVFGKMAENAGQYLKKGSKVYIEGRLQTQKWQDQNGQDRYTTSILANELQFMGDRSDNAQATPQQAPTQQGYQQPVQQQPQSAPQPVQQPQQSKGFDDFDDDIPFANPYQFAYHIV